MTLPAHYQDRGLNARLTVAEKRELAIAARSAFKVLEGHGATDESFDEFRHRIAMNACGRRISEALRGDYSHIMAMFCAISGDTTRAFHRAMRGETEGRRIAAKKLEELLKEQGRDISYCYPLFTNMHKTTLEQANAKQVWSVFFSLKGTNAQRSNRQKNFRKSKP